MNTSIEQWEYKVVERFHQGDVETAGQSLNALGKEGWELVAVAGSAVDGKHIAYLKRRVQH